MDPKGFPVIATDGFKFSQQVVWRIFGVACLYGQVVKKRWKDRIVKVEHKTRFGPMWRWEQARMNSEDSKKAEQVLHRTTESDYPTGFDLPVPPDTESRQKEAAFARSSRTVVMPLQLRQTTSRFEVWVQSPNSSHAGRTCQESVNVPRHLHLHPQFLALDNDRQ